MMVPMRLTFPPPPAGFNRQGAVSGYFQASQNARFFTAWNSMMNTMNAFLTCIHCIHHDSSCEKWWRIDLNNCGLLNLTNGFTVRRIRPLCHATIIGNLHHPATQRMSHLNLSALFPWMLFEKPSSMFTLQPFRMCIGFRLTIMISVPIALHPCMHP